MDITTQDLPTLDKETLENQYIELIFTRVEARRRMPQASEDALAELETEIGKVGSLFQKQYGDADFWSLNNLATWAADFKKVVYHE